MKRVLVVVLFLNIIGFSTGLSFYDGDIHLQTAFTTLEIDKESVEILGTYLFINEGTSIQSAQISFDGYSDEAQERFKQTNSLGLFSLASGERITVTIQDNIQINESTSSLWFDPAAKINGNAIISPTSLIKTTLTFTPSDTKLLSSSFSYLDSGIKDLKHQYISERTDAYMRLISLRWLENAPTLSLTRTYSSIRGVGDLITISTKIQNTGKDTINDLYFEDSILASYLHPNSITEF